VTCFLPVPLSSLLSYHRPSSPSFTVCNASNPQLLYLPTKDSSGPAISPFNNKQATRYPMNLYAKSLILIEAEWGSARGL
jgi:hypothetical protein